MAVILDNLDLDEEKKKEKLQQVVVKKTVQRVPVHLKLLTACGPKLISAPKISAAGVEVPNLTEADMKTFYETGENKDMKEAAVYSTEQFAFPHQQSPPTGTLRRQSSELSELQLLSVDSNVSTVSSHHEKFQGERTEYTERYASSISASPSLPSLPPYSSDTEHPGECSMAEETEPGSGRQETWIRGGTSRRSLCWWSHFSRHFTVRIIH